MNVFMHILNLTYFLRKSYQRGITRVLWNKLCPPLPNSNVKVLTPGSQNVTVLGDRAFEKVIKFNYQSYGDPYSSLPGL